MDEAGVDRALIVPPSWEGDRVDFGLEAVKYPDRFASWRAFRWRSRKKRAVAVMGEGAGHEGHAPHLHIAQDSRGSPTARPTGFGPSPKRRGSAMVHARNTSTSARIGERHPKLKLIVDHMNRRQFSGTIPRRGDHDTVAMAKYPNICVKVSACPGLSREPFSFRTCDLHEALLPRLRLAALRLGHRHDDSLAKASYRQRIMHFTEQLAFLNESDKDWVMGRAIMQRLKWT